MVGFQTTRVQILTDEQNVPPLHPPFERAFFCLIDLFNMKQQEKQGRHTFKFSIYLVIRSKNEERRTCAAPFQGTKIEGLTGKPPAPVFDAIMCL